MKVKFTGWKSFCEELNARKEEIVDKVVRLAFVYARTTAGPIAAYKLIGTAETDNADVLMLEEYIGELLPATSDKELREKGEQLHEELSKLLKGFTIRGGVIESTPHPQPAGVPA